MQIFHSEVEWLKYLRVVGISENEISEQTVKIWDDLSISYSTRHELPTKKIGALAHTFYFKQPTKLIFQMLVKSNLSTDKMTDVIFHELEHYDVVKAMQDSLKINPLDCLFFYSEKMHSNPR